MHRKLFLTTIVVLAAAATVVGVLPAAATSAGAARSASATVRDAGLRRIGTVNLGQLSAAARSNPGDQSRFGPYKAPLEYELKKGEGNGGGVPDPSPTEVTQQDTPGFFGFPGITQKQQRESNHGNHYSVEPAEPVICQANGQVFEVVNSALRVYTTGGTPLSDVIDINAFMLLPPAIDRSHKPHFPGPFSGDIQCEYDQGSGRWFILIWAIAQDPGTGANTGANFYYTAVSQTSDAMGGYWIFQSNADTPHPNDPEPRAGDHPFIGTDANVFVIQDNEFSFFGDAFFGSVVHAFSKENMVNGIDGPEVIIRSGRFGGGQSYSLQPATVPPGGAYETAQGGTLYFASALDFENLGDNRIGLWALTNTSLIDTPQRDEMVLQSRVLRSELYSPPGKVTQKAGPTPLGDAVGEEINVLDGGSDETQPTKFAAGSVWTVLNTGLTQDREGLAWFQITPSFDGSGNLTGTLDHQGYVAIEGDGNSVAYGAFAVKPTGEALIAMDVAGPDYNPSSAYGLLDVNNGLDAVHLAGTGKQPDDGFTCYAAFVGDRSRGCRWGDYSDANVGMDGNFWFSGIYFGNLPRRSLSNWDTFLGST